MRELLVHGMFRSGTTLLSRMLGAGGRNLIVTDPFVYFFRAYRNYHLESLAEKRWKPEDPTCDHFRPRHPEANHAILNGDLSEFCSDAILARMVSDIREWKHEQHPRLCAALDQLTPGTFAEVYQQLITLCVQLYGDARVESVGAKLSWCEEYLPALARAFPKMSFVLIVRDLRSIVASQNSQTSAGAGKRPLLFYARHWRKSVAYARYFSQMHPTLRNRTYLLRYEDLVRAPMEQLELLCATTGLDLDPAMVETACFRSESETGTWVPNTSFEPNNGIYQSSIDRWKEILSDDQRRTIEALAGPELYWMGYSLPPGGVDNISKIAALEGEPRVQELADWIRDLDCCDYLRDPDKEKKEHEAEATRRAILEGQARCAPQQLGELFPAPDGFEALQVGWFRYLRSQDKPKSIKQAIGEQN